MSTGTTDTSESTPETIGDVPLVKEPFQTININGRPLLGNKLSLTRLGKGSGTEDDPFVVRWDTDDPERPTNWSRVKRISITAQLATSTLTASLGSSIYSGGITFTMRDLNVSTEVALLGVSLYVLGFGLGPLIFAPLSETFGRRRIFLTTFSVYTLLNLGGALKGSIVTLLVCRALSGIFGASLLTNGSGIISDIWLPRQRGIAAACYSATTGLGPVLGVIIGGFTAQNPRLGWRFNFWILIMFSVAALLFGALNTPETGTSMHQYCYGAVQESCKKNPGARYITHQNTTLHAFLFLEPIVTSMAIYMSFTYAMLYGFFAVFPIVFLQHRGFTPGQTGLAFLGVGAGTLFGSLTMPLQNVLYNRAILQSKTGRAPPEARLYGPMLGGTLLPISLFWFAWTTQSSVHYIIPIIAAFPFGMAFALVLPGIIAYLLDSYGVYGSSAVGATIFLRSVWACAFPLFTPFILNSLGDQWGTSMFGFFALLCTPMPLLLWKYGSRLRNKSSRAVHDDEEDD